MFLIPWNTDAPIYYWPFATVALIAVNVVVFFATVTGDPELIVPWCLIYGDGLHPAQWVTSNFLHGSLTHLVGNMIFLWSFGVVVEGKIGWWKFLLVYLGLGGLQCALEQSMSLWSEGGLSLGASAVVFGLMAMALVWAPKNEMSCVGIFFLRVFEVDLSIQLLAGAYIGLDFASAVFNRLAIGTELLHSMGAVLGMILGIVMVKLDWVDCEGWDLLTLLAKRYGKPPGTRSRSVEYRSLTDPADVSPSPVDGESAQVLNAKKREKALVSLRKLLAQGQGHAAIQLYEKTVAAAGKWELPERDLLQLINVLHAEKAWADSIPLLEDYLLRFKEHEITLRLRLAKIVIQEQRPAYALRLLEKLPREPLPETLEKLRRRLVKQATEMKDDGFLELEGKSW